jgi:hypothetical protein
LKRDTKKRERKARGLGESKGEKIKKGNADMTQERQRVAKSEMGGR